MNVSSASGEDAAAEIDNSEIAWYEFNIISVDTNMGDGKYIKYIILKEK